MSSQPEHQPGQPDKPDRAAELLAAVRAVESGEASAASFFAAPEPPARPAARARPRVQQPASAPGGRGAGPVPEGVGALLAEGGAPEALGPGVAAVLGEQAEAVLREDPWQLLAVPGVLPEHADAFARAVLGGECGPDDERRGAALAAWTLEAAARRGHTALEPDALGRALAGHAVPDPQEAVRAAVEAGAVLLFEDPLGTPSEEPSQESSEEGEEVPVRVLLGLERYALAEESLAEGLARLAGTAGAADTAWGSVAARAAGDGRELAAATTGHGLVAHSGGEASRAEPAALVAAARAEGLRAYVAAHSADGRTRAAARLAVATEALEGPEVPAAAEEPDEPVAGPAVTVAGLVAGEEGPGRDADGALALDLLVVLDAPQLDTETAAALVESLPDGARLVLSGDPHLLGPAGAGQVFTDVLAARACPHVVSRTPDPGPVGELVSGVGIGELNQVDAPEREVVIVPVRDAGEAVHRTVQLVADSVPRAIGVAAERTQVITPGHGGAAGTRALNAALKQRLNPGPGRFGGFDAGDRVTWSPAAGRTAVGVVEGADEAGLHLGLGDAGRVVVPPGEVGERVRHGWAVTAHQAAGTGWEAAVVVLPGDATDALTREWVYTAFSRGRRHLSVVHGAGDALPKAVAQVHEPQRTTRLPMLLAQAVRAATAEVPAPR